MSNIHPCPFCKSDDVAVFGRLWGGEINDGIRCASCGAEADIYLWDELANHIRDLEAQLARLVDAWQAGYSRGHNDTVESCYNPARETDPEAAHDWINDQATGEGK